MADVFSPVAKSFSLSVTTSSTPGSLDPTSPQIVLHNDGSSSVLVIWGKGSQTATTSDLGWIVSLPANGEASFTKGSADSMAAICASGSTTLRVMQGCGQ